MKEENENDVTAEVSPEETREKENSGKEFMVEETSETLSEDTSAQSREEEKNGEKDPKIEKENVKEQFYCRKEVEKMLDEAEQRGYLRGKNEKIELTMRGNVDAAMGADLKSESDLLILRKLRESKWGNSY